MRPAVADRTETAYARLPEAYRDADAVLDWPLLRYLSLLLDQLEPLDALVERIDYDVEEGDATSDLVDGATANAGWFPWLAQLLGVDLTGLTIEQQREALADPTQAWAHGSPGALAAAAARGLTGTRSVTITPHHGGAPFVIGIGTKDSETTAPDSWGELKAYAPTWGDLHALGTFAKAAAPLVLSAVERERPAGYRLVRYSTGA